MTRAMFVLHCLKISYNKQLKTPLAVTKEAFGSGSDIPEEKLRYLGHVINGIPPQQFWNLSLTEIDTIAAFGRITTLSMSQLMSLQEAILVQWSSKELPDFTSYDLIALRQIVCSFNDSEMELIHPESYRDAASELGTLVNCPQQIFESLAELAMDDRAFGHPSKWTSIQVANVGCVISGLPNLREIPAESMEGLTKAFIECLPPETIQSMSSEQLRCLSGSAAAALSPSQLGVLSPDQMQAIDSILAGPDSSATSLLPSPPTLLSVPLFLTVPWL